LLLKVGITDPSKVIDFVVPRMLKAVDYLKNRHTDNDGLLEQNHNENWMDTILRAGKIVYSQACWILALSNLSSLLSMLGRKNKLGTIIRLRDKAINAVDKELWSEEDDVILIYRKHIILVVLTELLHKRYLFFSSNYREYNKG
jgi:glycogen debranching enzyme